ncbi:MAG: hypothetical protein K6T57_07390 [Thermaceae bacterium]|nr:hypothetical protein [Thermaceae bacterium]
MAEPRNPPADGPPGLEQGLYLEQHHILLPWYTSHRAARMLLGLEDARPDKDTLTWNGMRCLGGLSCAISGRFVCDETHDAPKPSLRLIEFALQRVPGEALEELYGRVKAHLSQQLGPPTLEYDGNEGHLRAFAEWDGEEVMVMWKVVVQGGQEDCLGEIWRKPLPKEYLKLTLTRF